MTLVYSTVVYSPLHGFILNQLDDQLPVGSSARLVKRCTGIAEVMGSNPPAGWIFSGPILTTAQVVSWKRLWLFIVVNHHKSWVFSFVSRCSHVWYRSRRFDCILLVFFRRWGRLVMRDLIKHDALLWLVGFQQLWLVHFDPCCSLSDLPPRQSAVAWLSCSCVFWSWASTLLEFLFHNPCWCC